MGEVRWKNQRRYSRVRTNYSSNSDPSLVPFSTFYNRAREPQHAVGPTPGNCRPRAKTEVPQPPKRSEPSRPRTKPKPPRPRTRSEAIQTRGRPEPIRPRIRSEAVRSRTKLEDVQQAPISELVRLRTKSLGPPSELVFPSEFVFPRGVPIPGADVRMSEQVGVGYAFVECSDPGVSGPLLRLTVAVFHPCECTFTYVT